MPSPLPHQRQCSDRRHGDSDDVDLNAGAIYNAHGSSLRGQSNASTNAYGYKAVAGTSTASTTIYNSGSLESLHYTGIHG